MTTTSSDDFEKQEAATETSYLAISAGEMFGTFILVFFGVGAVMAAVSTGAQAGLWQVAVVWAIGVSLAIYATAALPALT